MKEALEAMDIRVERVVVFGSHAEGSADEESDIDIAVISGDFRDKNILQRFELLGTAFARAKITTPVDAIAYTPDEFESKKEGTFAGDEIKSKGVELF